LVIKEVKENRKTGGLAGKKCNVKSGEVVCERSFSAVTAGPTNFWLQNK